MGLEELVALLVRLVGWHVAHRLLSRLVEDAQQGEQPLSGRCVQPFDVFDCDELGIYEEE